jgi:hypothetical protein
LQRPSSKTNFWLVLLAATVSFKSCMTHWRSKWTAENSAS